MAKKEALTPFDATDYLTDAASIAEFLNAAMEEANGDQALIMHALNTALRAQKRNMSQLATDAGVTRSGLYDALTGTRNPSLGTVLRLLDAMGLHMAVAPAK